MIGRRTSENEIDLLRLLSPAAPDGEHDAGQTRTPLISLSAVSKFLRDELLPTLSAHHAFQLRVSCNARSHPAPDLAGASLGRGGGVERLRKLLAHDGDLATLNADFAQKIADGALTLETPGVKGTCGRRRSPNSRSTSRNTVPTSAKARAETR